MTREFILQKTISDNPDLTFEQCAVIAMELYSQQVAKEAAADGWVSVGDGKPTEYGKYEVYRHGCKKQHYETWNNTGWAYNNNDITHFRKIIPPAK